MAQGGTTLLVYMGVARLLDIRDGLLAGGMPASMPVAMIENASLPQQREQFCTLGGLLHAAQTFQLRAPAILVIGEVTRQAGWHSVARHA